jgi:hypothetical protein
MTLHRYSQSPVVLAACRSDFASFIRPSFQMLNPNSVLQMNWHHYALAHHLELVRRGSIRRLIINLPRRALKSFMTKSVFRLICLAVIRANGL